MAERAGLWQDNVSFMRALGAAVLAAPVGDGLAEVQPGVHAGRVDVEVASVETHFVFVW